MNTSIDYNRTFSAVGIRAMIPVMVFMEVSEKGDDFGPPRKIMKIILPRGEKKKVGQSIRMNIESISQYE